MKKILAFLLFTCLLIGCNKTVTSNKIAGKYSLDERNLKEIIKEETTNEEESFLNNTILYFFTKVTSVNLVLREDQTCSLDVRLSPLVKKFFKEDAEQSLNGRYRVDGEYCYITINDSELGFFILENYSGLYADIDNIGITFNRVKE